MNYSFEYIDIILLAMIAGFIFLRLRGILGKRTGFEGKSPAQFKEVLKNIKVDQAAKPKEKFDVILCLGSINFGSQSKIETEVAHCASLLEQDGVMFFRVNPGMPHDKPESKWIDFFAWNVPFIIELADKLNLKVLDIRDDTNKRKYFVYRKI